MKRFGLLVVLGLLAATWGVRADGPILILHLKPAITVVDPLITVADVAALADGSQKLRDAVANLDLVELDGSEAALITRDQLLMRIQIAGLDARNIRIAGAKQTEVTLDRSQISESSVVAAARQAVRRKYPGRMDRGSLKLAESILVPKVVRKPKDHVYFAADWVGSPRDHGLVEIEVGVCINGKRQATVPVLLDLGEPTLSKKPSSKATDIQPVTFKQPAKAGGPQPKKDVLPSAPVVSQAAVPADNPIVIRPRDTVRLIARLGALRISAAGEALQEGRVGQMIRVRNIDSNKVVTGRVVEPGIVDIDF